MDHLPTPLSASAPPIEVPFVADIPWDFKDFKGFPGRHGFPVSENGELLLDLISEKRLASLLQSWLYFGFLSTILGRKVREEDFCRMRPPCSTKPAATVLDSTGLWCLMEVWRREMYDHGYLDLLRLLSSANRIKRSRKRVEARKRLFEVQRTCVYVARHPIALSYPVPEILLSVEILCTTFDWMLNGPYPANPGSIRLVARQMIDRGWCRALVTHVSEEYDIGTLYFISRIKPPQVPWIRHDQCSDFHCIANHVRKTTYQNRHVTEHCSCKLIHVEGESRKQMIRIIRGGGVPLIKIKEIPPGTVELDISEHKPGLSYIAISHVWSDGLGNPHANALPLCQLQKLANLLKQHPSDGIFSRSPKLFWMDTLCIPPAERGHPEYPLRLDCIDRMALIYASAWSVLVLDYGLQQVRLGACSYEEVAVHLVCCAWNQRCWTLQEGALGQRTFFQLADGTINPSWFTVYRDKLLLLSRFRRETFLQAVSDSMARTWSRIEFFYRALWLRGFPCKMAVKIALRRRLVSSLIIPLREKETVETVWERRNSRTYGFAEAWNALRKRTTTMPEDTYVVLANLLGFHPYKLSSLQKGDRLKAIILNMNRVPQSLLYNAGKRIIPRTYSGQRWIPAEISRMALSTRSYMERSAGGFVISRLPETGLIVVTPPLSQDDGPIWLRCDSLERRRDSNPTYVWIRIDLFRPSPHSRYDPALYKESCILINENGEYISHSTPRPSWRAALLHTCKENGPNNSNKASSPPMAKPSKVFRHLYSLLRRIFPITWKSGRSVSQDSRTGANKELFHVTYDCPAKVTMSSELEPGRKSRRSSLHLLENESEELAYELDPLGQPPWESQTDRYEFSRVRTPQAPIVQDDCLMNTHRGVNFFPRTRKAKQAFVTDSAYAVHFPQSWELILQASETKDDMLLVQRPHPIFNLLHLRSNPFLYAVRIVGGLVPLTCIILIGIYTPTLKGPGTHYNRSAGILSIHCILCICNLFSISHGSAFLLWLFVEICLIGLLAVYFSMLPYFSITELEMYVVLLPYLGCTLWTILWNFFCYYRLRTLGYRHWVSTFDRNWQPEKTKWWWRPVGVSDLMKRLRGRGSVSEV